MTETEITAEIAVVRTAIHNLMLTGQEYEIGTGPSKRIFKMVDIDKLRSYLTSLQQDLLAIQGDSGIQVGF